MNIGKVIYLLFYFDFGTDLFLLLALNNQIQINLDSSEIIMLSIIFKILYLLFYGI